MKVLFFAGAGTSVELNVPDMKGLASEFLEHSRDLSLEPDLVERIMGETLDVEHFIEKLDRICDARSSLETIHWHVNGLEITEKVRAGVEWFVQHSVERLAANDAWIVWGAVLRATKLTDITFVTTNYDRAIELAAIREKIQLDDGFKLFGDGETASWCGFSNEGKHPTLVKLHGSTDWYTSNKSHAPTKLRHPMPLFGRSELRLANGEELGSSLVLPSREKMLTKAPYPRLSQFFLTAADHCDLAIFIGSSLRDDHIRDVACSTASRVPVFIVNPEGKNYGVNGAVPIAQHASTFLTSTFPNALLTENPDATLRQIACLPVADAEGAFLAMKQMLNTEVGTNARCYGIEQLEKMRAVPEPAVIKQLLKDNDATVARYALGLIQLSVCPEELIKEAKQSPHISEPTFEDELKLLQKIIGRES